MKKMGFLMGMFGVMLAFVLVLSGCTSTSIFLIRDGAVLSWPSADTKPGTLTAKGAYKGPWVNEGVLIIPETFRIPNVSGRYAIGVIGADSFKDINLIRVVIPSSVTTIGKRAFSNNSITSITIPGNVSVGAEAFDNDFTAYYNGQAGRTAGTYTYDGSTWMFGWP
ncbi:hypothetical protein FACS189491_03600 [Spirochaetia bacterium]|nr:hypothetical protein FACS189491_03600 [Spirochaetia bacterium]